jgi:tetratricopeptide (TPR) repeat protein
MARRPTGAADTLDELQTGADRLGEFLQAHVRELVIGIAALLLAAGAISWAMSARRHGEEEASIALDKTRSDYLRAMGASPGALDVPELANPEAAKRIREDYEARFMEIGDQHAGTVNGALARLEATDLMLAAGQTDAALEALARLRAEAPSRPGLQGMILQREAQVLEQAQRYAEAADRHEQAADLDGYPLHAYALADAARCRVLAGQPDAARALYTRLDSVAPELRLPDYQRLQKRELEGAAPEGAAPPAAPAPTATPEQAAPK